MCYAIVIERTETNFCAYVPDLPGCIATGHTLEETEALIREALAFHIRTLHADGSMGWPPAAPYDVIFITAAAPYIPQPLLDQLADGGRLVAPIGDPKSQTLLCIRRRGDQIQRQKLTKVRFVPLIGKYGWKNFSSN